MSWECRWGDAGNVSGRGVRCLGEVGRWGSCQVEVFGRGGRCLGEVDHVSGRGVVCLGEVEDAKEVWNPGWRGVRFLGEVDLVWERCKVWERWKMPGICGSSLGEV